MGYKSGDCFARNDTHIPVITSEAKQSLIGSSPLNPEEPELLNAVLLQWPISNNSVHFCKLKGNRPLIYADFITLIDADKTEESGRSACEAVQ